MPSFEESLKKLETIVEQLEKGDLALEDSLKLFEEGVNLSAACKQELEAAEGKVQMLVKQRDGSLEARAISDGKAVLVRCPAFVEKQPQILRLRSPRQPPLRMTRKRFG